MTTAATRRITFSADRLRNVKSTETLDDQAQVPTLNTAVLGAVLSLHRPHSILKLLRDSNPKVIDTMPRQLDVGRNTQENCQCDAPL
jgi:hypothetical protein